MLIGQLAAERQPLDGGEVLGLAPAAEPELLELHEHERGEVVVEERGRDVLGPQPDSRHSWSATTPISAGR